MDFPDMDELLDSLEDSSKSIDKIETSTSNLNLTSKNVDDSADKTRQQQTSVKSDDKDDKNLVNLNAGNNASTVNASNQMKGLEDVLNELDLEDNNKASTNSSLKEINKKEQNEVHESKNIKNDEFKNGESSSHKMDIEESVNIKESSNLPEIENTIEVEAIRHPDSQQSETPDIVIKGLPENIERILTTSFSCSSSALKNEDETKTELLETTNEKISLPNEKLEPVQPITIPDVNITAEAIQLENPYENSEALEKIFVDEIVACLNLDVVVPIIIPEIKIDEVETLDRKSMEVENVKQQAPDKTKNEFNEKAKEEKHKENDEQNLATEIALESSNISKNEAIVNTVIAETQLQSCTLTLLEPELTGDIPASVDVVERKEEEPTHHPICFDTSQEIDKELDEELLAELEQMAEEQVNEGTIEAAAIVAAELRDAEPELEPARSYISDAPLVVPPQSHPNSVILSTHDLSIVNANPPLTESELQLGKTKPYWIPDEDCSNCMLCSTRFTVINRRHHCRCCGRVLCSSCCSIKKALPYIEDSDKKQRVCEPCSKTLVKIENYENAQAELQRIQLQRRQQNLENVRTNNEGSEEAAADTTSNAATVQRKKSVLKSKNAEKSETGQKRTVNFLDGVRPGHDSMDQPGSSGVIVSSSLVATSPATAEEATSDEPKAIKKKIPKGTHRRNRERRVQEEQISLVREDHLFLVDYDAQMTKLSIDKVLKKLIDGEKITVAIKRNFWVVIQLLNYRNSKVWFFSSQGMATIGSDELVISFESHDSDFEIIEEVIQFFSDERKRVEENKGNSSDSTETSDISVTDNLSPPRNLFITSILYLFDHFFLEALIPSNESLDEKVGIRRCGERISNFYRVPQGEINGIETTAVIFHRPIGQNFENLPIPSYSPFLIGTFIQKSELIWAMTIPNRLLLKIGLQASNFPFPIVNERNRSPAYTDSSENTVLKVFNDFKNWSYRLPKIIGSTAEIQNGSSITIRIPKWANEEIKQMLESNRNMLAWATMLTDHSDCHLVAIQNPETTTFRTEIFTDVESTREKIGCSFIVLDGSLKNSPESFVMSIVEDGIIIRFSSETLEEVIKCLLSSTPYSLNSSNMAVNILFEEPYEPKYKTGGLISPIDQLYLIGKYQYGLNLSRQFRSQMLIPKASEWALRLSTVINIEDGKIPIQLQPRYFEICEQVGTHMAATIGSFVKQLAISDQRQICIRIKIENDSVSYDTAQWHGLEQEHYVWTAALDNQLIPYLYQLCQFVNTFHMELHFSLISIRLLTNVEY